MVYSPTFTIKINRMQVNIPYMDGIFFISLNNIPFERYHDPVLQLRKMLAAPRSDELTLVIWLRYRLTQVQSMNGVFTYMKTPYSYS